jgi:superfamily II DNA or RNA helicase
VTAALKLREYQEEALAALHEGWAAGKTRLAVVLPTGLGKTVIFSHLAHQTHADGLKVLILVHREELVSQAVQKIHSVAPDLRVGVVKAARNEFDGDVVVASVQTLARAKRREQIDPDAFGLIIVDEAHHAVARTWVEVLEYFGAFGGHPVARRSRGDWTYPTPVAGFTATMSREDGKGLGDIWEEVVYTKDIRYGIEHDPPYLVDVRGKSVTVDGLDLATVARSRGDYQDGALGEALEASGAGEVIAAAYLEHSKDRQGVVFAPTVATAHAFADDLNAAGVVTEVITGATSLEDRELIYKRFRHGDVQVLSNCMVLTEGWDAPWCSTAVIARPTSSAALYVQMVGRILRPWPGKPDALVLDVVGVAAKHALRTIADLTTTEVRPQDGESLGEAIEREAIERETARKKGPKTKVAGTVGASDVDLFHRSASVWLQTEKGVWFIPTRDWFYFLWEAEDSSWILGRCPTWANKEANTIERVHDGMTLEYAMAWGEQEAAEDIWSTKAASWRKGKAKATEKQIAYLAQRRIPITEGLTKNDASALIDRWNASQALDKFLK